MDFFQIFRPVLLLTGIIFFGACDPAPKETNSLRDGNLVYEEYSPESSDLVISRSAYLDKLYGFWLGESIGNWTGLVTEMDKIGNIGEIQIGDFYTREDWGSPDLPSVFGEGVPSDLSEIIDFVQRKEGEVWGSDDDTDIEYMYQYLLYTNQTSILTPVQIREGWLKHIKSEEENYLWVSNQTAFNLMEEGMLPPLTGDPINNKHFDMIDAQLTTEIFGLFAPARPDKALELANLPIQTTARNEAQKIAEFYVIMHSLASKVDSKLPMKDQLMWMSKEARKNLPADSYPAKMYDFVFDQYENGAKWESTRDSLYVKYQENQEDGYAITSKNLYCNGCFAAGINF